MNCDSILFSRKSTDSMESLPIGSGLGQLKHQIPDALKITSFNAISPTVSVTHFLMYFLFIICSFFCRFTTLHTLKREVG